MLPVKHRCHGESSQAGRVDPCHRSGHRKQPCPPWVDGLQGMGGSPCPTPAGGRRCSGALRRLLSERGCSVADTQEGELMLTDESPRGIRL